MRSLILVLMSLCCAGIALAETAYVKVEVVNERSGPGTNFPIQNRLYIGQKITIYDRHNGWVRVTDAKYSPRWIAEYLISSTKPRIGQGFVLPSELLRADLIGLDKKPIGNLSGEDIIALRRFGAHVLDSRQCKSVEYGDESVNRAGQIYVVCGDYSKKYALKSDWID